MFMNNFIPFITETPIFVFKADYTNSFILINFHDCPNTVNVQLTPKNHFD